MVRKVSLTALRRTLGVVVVVCGGGAAMPTAAHAGLTAFAGVCVLDLRVTFTSPADLSLSPTSVAFSGAGTCLVNEVVTTGSFSGTAATTPTLGWTCGGGFAVGSGTFDSAHPSMAPFNTGVVLQQTGGVLTVAAHAIPTFSGVGEFLQSAAATSACLTGQAQWTISYSGAFAFEDPTYS